MGIILGVLFVLGTVFGGYILSGGKLDIIIHGLPLEGMMIMGGAIGAMIVGNSGLVLKGVLKCLGISFKGAKWKKKDFHDLLCLMFMLCKLMRGKGLIAVESHIEKPEESSIFSQYPKIAHDHFVTELVCDTLRSMSMGLESPMEVEEMMDKKIEKHHMEAHTPQHALQTMADGLPAIGIVAAVLGVIKTMASINEPPAVLGAMIGGALVGTFLGVFLSYCVVGPLASKVKLALDQDAQFYVIIRSILVAHLKGLAPQIAVDMGRGLVPGQFQPSFNEMEEMTSALKVE